MAAAIVGLQDAMCSDSTICATGARCQPVPIMSCQGLYIPSTITTSNESSALSFIKHSNPLDRETKDCAYLAVRYTVGCCDPVGMGRFRVDQLPVKMAKEGQVLSEQLNQLDHIRPYKQTC